MKKSVSAILTIALLSTSISAFGVTYKPVIKTTAVKKSISNPINKSVKYEVLTNLKSLKPDVISKIQTITKSRGFFYMDNKGSNDFIFRIAAGKKPNAGYGIKIKSVNYTDGKMKIVVEETLPKSGMVYAEQLVYPTVTFKAPLVSEVVEVKNTKGQSFKFIMSKAGNVIKDTNKESIFINNISSISAGKLLVPEGAYSKELSMTELSEYFGRNPMPIVPTDFKPQSDKVDIMFKADGNIFYMNEFSYSKDINDPNSAEISLQLNKGSLPLRDCFYNSEPKESIIGMTKLIIGSIKMNDSTNLSTGDYNVYTSQFIFDGIGYDITAKKIDEATFLSLLKSIIK